MLNIPSIDSKSPLAIATPENPSIKEKSTVLDLIQNFTDQLGFNQQLPVEKLLNQKFSNQELILYQIQASNYHLRVEMFSKVAESFLQTFRKIQANQ